MLAANLRALEERAHDRRHDQEERNDDRADGQELYSFKVTAEDNGEPGANDSFQIEIWLGVVDTENGPSTPKHKAKGVLGGGNIKIHQ